MYSKLWGTLVPARMRAFASRGASVVLASTGIWLMTGATVYAEDTATLQRLEAHMQQLEERHQSEIKALQAEIRQLRRQKPATVATTETPPVNQQHPLAPTGVLSPALPPKVLMTYDRGYHFGFS